MCGRRTRSAPWRGREVEARHDGHAAPTLLSTYNGVGSLHIAFFSVFFCEPFLIWHERWKYFSSPPQKKGTYQPMMCVGAASGRSSGATPRANGVLQHWFGALGPREPQRSRVTCGSALGSRAANYPGRLRLRARPRAAKAARALAALGASQSRKSCARFAALGPRAAEHLRRRPAARPSLGRRTVLHAGKFIL